jgi:acyl-coenzyme A thioesterase PaaI-like protein
MSERWTFGLQPLPQATAVAPLLRRVAALAVSLDGQDPVLAALIDDLRAAERTLAARVPPDPAPRIGEAPSAQQRPYLDHSRDIGAFNPCFAEYELSVEGATATGTVTFPLAFEGPPGIVHGGVLATFFDCVVQHHNCDVGVAGKTTSLLVEYRRPTPLDVMLAVVVDRHQDDRRITSKATLSLEGDTTCTATVEAVAGDRSRLPAVAPRIVPP